MPSSTARSPPPALPSPLGTSATGVLVDVSATTPASTSSRRGRGMTANGGGNEAIQVVCRFRPARETDPFAWFDASRENSQVKVRTPDRVLDFTFDHVFTASSTQADVYESVKHVVRAICDGYNGTLLTYGQTSSGKTHTMMGKAEAAGGEGIIPRAVDELFTMVAESKETLEFTFKLSYVEIYCERIRDLLEPERGSDLKIREDPHEGVVIAGATEVYVGGREEIFKVIELGQALRATSATRMNEESSRSHALVMLTVTQKNTETLHIRRGKLVLVDLAGSERISKTGAAGLRLEEAKNINRSLTTLGMVINALSDGKPHVPYRDAKLTRVLEESLGGNSRTCLIICCAPELHHSQETISTLRFGERAKRIKNRAVVNEELSAFELQQLLNKAMVEIASLRAQLIQSQSLGASTSRQALAVSSSSLAVSREAEDEDEDEEVSRSGSGASSSSSGSSSSGDEEGTHVDEEVDLSRVGATEDEEEGDEEEEEAASAKLQQQQLLQQEAEEALAIELAQLRALLAAKDEENARLTLAYAELKTRLAEEEAAVAMALEEQRMLETRLREAEANMDQMMRAVTSVPLAAKGAAATAAASSDGDKPAIPREEPSVRAAEVAASHQTPPQQRRRSGSGAADADDASPFSPDARHIYEEKLQSVEKICTYLQDELDAQREAFESVNRALLTQNAQLAMQKDVHVRQIFSLEVKVEELETALRSLRNSLSGKLPYADASPRQGGLGSSLSSLFRSSAAASTTKGIVKTITGGRKASPPPEQGIKLATTLSASPAVAPITPGGMLAPRTAGSEK